MINLLYKKLTMNIRLKSLGSILHRVKCKREHQFKKTELWIEGKHQLFCLRDGQAAKIISERHQIEVTRRTGKQKMICVVNNMEFKVNRSGLDCRYHRNTYCDSKR
jgi:hypothetical protein